MAWAKTNAAISKEDIEKNQSLLELALSATVQNQPRIQEITSLLEAAYAEEKAFWRQRSRIQWLNGGDRNSAFFHAVTRGRRARNKFTVIENEEGHAFYDEEEIVATFNSFYQALFTAGSSGSNSREVVQEALSAKLL